MFSAETALSTCAMGGLLGKRTVNSVPPAKSMPSRKCRVDIDRMPGMMITSDSRKNKFRRLTMSSRRTLGGAAGLTGAFSSSSSSSSSSTASAATGSSSESLSSTSSASSASESDSREPLVRSDVSDTLYSKQRRRADSRPGEDDRQQVVSDHQRREQAREHSNAQH